VGLVWKPLPSPPVATAFAAGLTQPVLLPDGVLVGGMGVLVGGTGVLVGPTGVLVGVLVGGSGVLVGPLPPGSVPQTSAPFS